MTNCRTKLCFGGLDPTDAEEMARLLWAGRFDLQRAMPKRYRMTAVGNERVLLRQGSQSRGTSTTSGQTWSQGTAIAQSSATTSGRATALVRSRTISAAETESESETEQWSTTRARSRGSSTGSAVVRGSGESAGASMTPDGLLLSGETVSLHVSHNENTALAENVSEQESESVAETEGGASTTGRARTRGTAQSEGTTASRSIARTTGRTSTQSSQHGGSRTSGVSHGSSDGWSEAYVAQYGRVAGSLYSLADQVHMKSVSLANSPVGVAWLKVGAGRPRRVDIPYLRPTTLSAERIERVRRQLIAASPYVRSAADIDASYLTHRQQLQLAATTALTPPTIEVSADEDGVEWK